MPHLGVPQFVLERLLLEEESKDVTIQVSDGVLRAHSCMLQAHSDAFTSIFSNTPASNQKTLSWSDHTLEVGRALLNLLYTGTTALGKPRQKRCFDGYWYESGKKTAFIQNDTIHWPEGRAEKVQISEDHCTITLLEAEFDLDGSPNCVGKLVDDDEIKWSDGDFFFRRDSVPLHVLIGCLGLAKLYLISHLLNSLVQSLTMRLSTNTFNTICAAAIRYDVTALRMACLRFAEQSCYVDAGAHVAATCCIPKWEGTGNIPAGCKGEIKLLGPRFGQPELLIEWDDEVGYSSNPFEVLTLIRFEDPVMQDNTPLRRLYNDNALKPEVISELAGIWALPEPRSKRARLL